MSLSHSQSKIIQQLLIDLSLASFYEDSSNWPCFINLFPDLTGIPDEALAVIETAGVSQGRNQYGQDLIRLGYQILVRSDDNESCSVKSLGIKSQLDLIHNRTVTVTETSGTATTDYKVFSLVTQVPLRVGLETPSSDRFLYSINGTISLRQSD